MFCIVCLFWIVNFYSKKKVVKKGDDQLQPFETYDQNSTNLSIAVCFFNTPSHPLPTLLSMDDESAAP